MKNLKDPIAREIVERFLDIDKEAAITEFHVHKSRIDDNGMLIMDESAFLPITVEYKLNVSEDVWREMLRVAADIEEEYNDKIIFELEPDAVERSYGAILWKRD